MKTIEFLYPEFANLYADSKNIEYLCKCNKSIKVVYTNVGDEPYFLKNKVDMIYMGSMPDGKIKSCISLLSAYKGKIKELIEKNVIFLATGNALEVFSDYINENNNKYDGLKIFNYYIEKDMQKKHASWFIGKYDGIYIVGHRNQFAKCYNIENKFIKKIGGYGIDLIGDNEGIHYKSFYGTYLLGPLLIMNPKFTKHLLKKLGLSDELFCEKDITKAYDRRVEHFKKDGTRFDMGQYG